MATHRCECGDRATHSGMKIRCCSYLVASTCYVVLPPCSSRSLLPEFHEIGANSALIFLNFIDDSCDTAKKSLLSGVTCHYKDWSNSMYSPCGTANQTRSVDGWLYVQSRQKDLLP
jgi:hypothetical protein